MLTAAGILLWLAGRGVLVLCASVLVAVFLRAGARRVQDWTRLSPAPAVAVVLTALTVLSAGGAWLLAPQVASQVDQLSEALPRSLDRLSSTVERYEWGRRLMSEVSGSTGEGNGSPGTIREFGRNVTGKLAAMLGAFLSAGAGALGYLLVALATGAYLAADFDGYRRGLIRLIEPRKRERADEIVGVVIHSLEGWLAGIAVSMTVLGVLTYIGLSVLGVPLALTLALFTALLTFVPNLGPVISVIPPMLLGFMDDPLTPVYVLLFYIVLQNLEGLVITPVVQRRAARIPPPVLLAAQVLLAALLGLYGLVLAAPLCAVGVVLVQMMYLEDRLGERIDLPGYESDASQGA